MQTKSLPKNLFLLAKYADRHPDHKKVDNRFTRAVNYWNQLKSEGVSTKGCERLVGISRATYYRYRQRIESSDFEVKPRHINQRQWTKEHEKIVLQIRRDDDYGKEKITRILKRDHHIHFSDSTVGRIIKHLMDAKKITRSVSAPRVKKKRQFNGHAKAWTYKEYDKMEIGERVQIDHMSVSKYGCSLKHFQAWDRKSKYMDATVFSRATSKCAKQFLVEFINKAPFTVKSIQVDGGSEFRADFEDACAEMNIPLIVLPPAKPTYNGGVERGNRIFREEFYNTNKIVSDTVGGIRNELKQQLRKYNTYRPHRALKGLTPMEYINNHSNLDAAA